MKINIKKRVASLQIPRKIRSEFVDVLESIHYDWLDMTAEAVAEYDTKYCLYDRFVDSTKKKMTNNLLNYVNEIVDTYIDTLFKGYDLALKDDLKAAGKSGEEVDYIALLEDIAEMVENGLKYLLSTLCDDLEIRSRELDLLMQVEFTEEFQRDIEIESEQLMKENAVIFWHKGKAYKIIRPLNLFGDALDYEDDEAYALTESEEKKATLDIRRGRLKEYTSSTIKVMGEVTKLLVEEKEWRVEREAGMREKREIEKAMRLCGYDGGKNKIS